MGKGGKGEEGEEEWYPAIIPTRAIGFEISQGESNKVRVRVQNSKTNDSPVV